MKSLKIETTKKFKHYGEKVKQIDFHQSQPLVLLAQYNGQIAVYNYSTQAFVKKIEVSSKALRSGVWAGEDYILTSGDDNQVRLFNFHTTQKLHQFEPHKDFVRRVIYNKAQGFILSCSDDKTIAKFTLVNGTYTRDCVWEEHKHFVMDIDLNPKEENTFASASLDGTVKVWNVKSTLSNYTLKGHKSGVNCVSFCAGERQFMLSGGDDFAVILWDLAGRTVLRKLEHHSGNVMDVLFLDPLPFFVSLSEDGKINFYNTRSFEFSFEVTNFMGKGWSLTSTNGLLGAGFDEGAVVLRLGAEYPPAASAKGNLFLVSAGKAQTSNLKALAIKKATNFEKIEYDLKEVGRPEIFPSKVSFAENGNVICLADGSEYCLYKFQGFKQIAFGKAKEFLWGPGNKFAILTDRNEIGLNSIPTTDLGATIATDLTDLSLFKLLSFDFFVEGVFGGTYLGISGNDGVMFYSWEGKVIGKVEVECKAVYSEKNVVIIQSTKSFFILKAGGEENPFELVSEIHENIQSGTFHAGLFFYITEQGKFCVLVDNTTLHIGHSGKANLLLGYIPNHERFFFFDPQNKLTSCGFSRILTELLKAGPSKIVVNGALTEDAKSLSEEERDLLSKALISDPETAYLVCANPRRKFELGLKLNKFEDCMEMAEEMEDRVFWKKFGDAALEKGRFSLAEKAYAACDDFQSLLLIYSSLGSRRGLEELASSARLKKNYNVSFSAYFSLGKTEQCLELLIEQGQFGQASAFAKNYLPSKLSDVFKEWKETLSNKGKAEAALASRLIEPSRGPLADQLKLQEELVKIISAEKGDNVIPAIKADDYFKTFSSKNFASVLKEKGTEEAQKEIKETISSLFVPVAKLAEIDQNFKNTAHIHAKEKEEENKKKIESEGWGDDLPEAGTQNANKEIEKVSDS